VRVVSTTGGVGDRDRPFPCRRLRASVVTDDETLPV
jgi:hypothetical protein